jgi:hypothetical protein
MKEKLLMGASIKKLFDEYHILWLFTKN